MKIEATPDQALISAIVGIHDWVESMGNYTDAQYGKGKMKSLLTSLVSKVIRRYGEHYVVDMVFTPSKSWDWNHEKFDFAEFLPNGNGTEATFSVCTNGVATVTFDEPQTGLLILKRRAE